MLSKIFLLPHLQISWYGAEAWLSTITTFELHLGESASYTYMRELANALPILQSEMKLTAGLPRIIHLTYPQAYRKTELWSNP